MPASESRTKVERPPENFLSRAIFSMRISSLIDSGRVRGSSKRLRRARICALCSGVRALCFSER